MPDNEEVKQQIEASVKQRSIAQGAFTRTLNSITKVLDGPPVPHSALTKYLSDIEERYKVLEVKCDAVFNCVPEEDAIFSDTERMLTDKYDLLTDVRARICKIIEMGEAGASASATETAELIKTFSASLTLPKPDFKKFNGNPSEYASFISYIETYVESSVKDSRQQLSFLIDSCVDIAYDSISFLSQCKDPNAAYHRAKGTLKELFGGKHQINRAVINECASGSQIKCDDTEEMKRLVISMKKAEVTLEESGLSSELSSTEQLKKIYHRLPKYLQNRWNDKVFELHEKDEKPSFKHMSKMIDAYMKSRDNEYCVQKEQRPVKSMSAKSKPVYAISQDCVTKCIMCNNCHYLNQCPEFLQMPLKSRYEFISKKQLCRNCLHFGHLASKCKRKGLCKRCSCKHNDLLHDDHFKHLSQNVGQSTVEVNNSSSESDTVMNVTRPGNVIGLACVEIMVEGKDALYKCKAIVDPKATVNLCTKRLANRLGLTSAPFKTSLNVATGTYAVTGAKIDHAKVYAKNMVDSVDVHNILSVDSIPLSVDCIFTPDDIDSHPHLQGIEIPHVSHADEIDLLIGSGVPKAFYKFEERKGGEDEIYAVRMTLGWELVGPKCMSRLNGPSSYSNALMSVESVFLINHSVDGDCSVSEDLSRVFHADFADCSLFNEKVGLSVEDKEALHMVKESVVLKDGQFCVGIPWKQDPINLPSSKILVHNRLKWLKRKFQMDTKLRKGYCDEMKKFIDSHYLELSSSRDTNLCHYIPHHPVWHPRKGSLRIVWDCAVSLNDFIHEGPDLLNSLVEVLIRFRRFKYAVCSDIRKMYLNVKVPPKDRGALRILWWPEGDFMKEPVEYRATVHIYGAKSSGFVANYCVRSLADKANNAMIEEAILNDLYVDDQISSISNETDAVLLVQGMIEILKTAGFHLTKFVSNCPEVLNVVPEADKESSVHLHLGEAKEEHFTLGLKWEVKSDELGFPCYVPNEKQTPNRRLLLSVIAKVYDPLGIISPSVLPLKVLMQRKSSLGWDESDEEMCNNWDEFCKVFEMVSGFKIARCYKPCVSEFDNPTHISLHGFSDASKEGYSAVVYIRQVGINEQVSVSFVLGKSRVAPKFKGHIPQATIPKLELNAAALLTKLVSKVVGCIGFSINEIVYWCDSQAVISCINSTNRRFPVYWANRLAIILGNSQVDQWRFVPTKCNPADVGSRGVVSSNFSKQIRLWVDGPDFLRLEPECWPENPRIHVMEDVMMVSDSKEEVDMSSLLVYIVQFYSCLFKLLRVIARLLRFMKYPKLEERKHLTSQDLKDTQESLIRFEQRLLVVSHLKRLKPFKDENGTLRVHSRLSKTSYPFDMRFPIILPKDSHLTKLLIQEEHKRSGHSGPNHVLYQLRQQFWVVGGKKTVKSAVSVCRKCREENARPLQQEMSPLPEERVKASYPFQFVGIDYFGPFLCKIRRQRIKRYGCIFVCLATRAVHIECVNSLETSAFLCALSRFISRRGVPQKIYSDNATNFKGAQDELKSVIVSNDEKAVKYCMSRSIQWHFHPPHGSHHGGHYERLIRSIRRILRGVTSEQEMTEENLTTFLCEAEKILNDRPLTSVSDDPNDDTPISPNTILLLRGNSCKELFESENVPKQYHRQAQYLANIFWSRWLKG